jgi:hypothetical protein
MRFIVVPKSLQIQGEHYSFEKFVTFLLDTDRPFNDSGAHIRAAARIEAALAENKEVLALEENDWELLKGSAEQPQCGYPMIVMTDLATKAQTRVQFARKLIPFVDAIADPPTEKPVSKNANGDGGKTVAPEAEE